MSSTLAAFRHIGTEGHTCAGLYMRRASPRDPSPPEAEQSAANQLAMARKEIAEATLKGSLVSACEVLVSPIVG